MGVEGGVMDFRERDAVRNHRLTKQLIFVPYYMCCIQKQWLWKSRQRAAAVVGADDGLPERCLVQPLLDCPEGISPFQRVLRRRQRLLIRYAERNSRLQCP